MTPREELAYCAGIMDGEGTILITELSPTGRRKSPQHRVYVAVVMTDSEIPELFAERWGGTTHTYERAETHKPATHWRVSGHRAAECCADLLPYLRLKRQQAELLIKFHEERLNSGTPKKRRAGVPPEELELRRGLMDVMQALNKRGREPALEVI